MRGRLREERHGKRQRDQRHMRIFRGEMGSSQNLRSTWMGNKIWEKNAWGAATRGGIVLLGPLMRLLIQEVKKTECTFLTGGKR